MPPAGAELERLLTTAAAGLDALPWGAHALAAAALVAGLIMWLNGRRFVKPLYALLFALGGAAIGFAGPSALGLHADPYLGLGIGLLVGFLVSAIVYRFTMALTLAGVAAVAAPLLAAAVINISESRTATDGLPDPSRVATDLLSQAPDNESIHATNGGANGDPITDADSARGSENESSPALLDDLQVAALEASERIRAVALAIWSDAIDRFDAMPPLHRLILLLAVLGGGAAGFALGFSFPGKVAAIATAFVGAAVWLGGASWMATLMSVPPSRIGLSSPLSWVVLWLAVSVAGTLIQWTALRPRADESR